MWQRTIHLIQDYFSVSPKEARGIAGLLFISVLALLFPVFLKHYLLYRSPAETARERAFLDSLVGSLANSRELLPARPFQPADRPPQKTVLKKFDPNTAGEAELLQLGIPAFLARRIINYRNNGGVFRKKEDLKRIYDFSGELFLTLEPFIAINPAFQTPNQTLKTPSPDRLPGKPPGDTHRLRPETKLAASPPAAIPFDINKADTTLLKTLKGIGSARAGTILRYRNALGGFYSEKQYPEIFGMDSLALSQLTQYARVLSPPQKILLNAVSREAFLGHPYARKDRRQAEAIIRYREQHGRFHTAGDLEKVVPLTPAYLEQLMPYLSFD